MSVSSLQRLRNTQPWPITQWPGAYCLSHQGQNDTTVFFLARIPILHEFPFLLCCCVHLESGYDRSSFHVRAIGNRALRIAGASALAPDLMGHSDGVFCARRLAIPVIQTVHATCRQWHNGLEGVEGKWQLCFLISCQRRESAAASPRSTNDYSIVWRLLHRTSHRAS